MAISITTRANEVFCVFVIIAALSGVRLVAIEPAETLDCNASEVRAATGSSESSEHRERMSLFRIAPPEGLEASGGIFRADSI